MLHRLTAHMKIRSLIILFLGILALGGGSISAQESAVPGFPDMTPGFIDANFKPVLGGNVGISAPANRTIVLADGKILVAGSFQLANGVSRNGIARFNSDGTLDPTFNTKNGATGGTINAMALQSNGKIIIGGAFTSYAGQPVGFIARLEADGNFDVTFNNGGGVGSAQGAGSAINEISVAADDRIYISGAFTTYNGTNINRLARLNVNGGLDTTFAVGTGLTGSNAGVIAQAPGGKIIIGGFFTAYNGTTVPRFARINSDGSLDTTFAIGTGPVGAPNTIKVLPDDKILVGGGGATFNGVARNGLLRLNPDGSVDTTFDAAVTGSAVTTFARQADGKIILSGNFTNVGGTARLNIARVGADGAFDATFDPGTGLNSGARAIALLTDGRAVLVGTFVTYNGTTRNSMAIVNADGSLDTGAITGLAARGELFIAARQADGKILVGGLISSADGAPRSNIARLNADGTNDATFIPGTGANQPVSAIAVQQDGKIIISGEFTQYNGTGAGGIARLNTDGSLDTSFNAGGAGIGAGFGGANSIAFQSDGKILIVGNFSTYNGVTINRIARLNTDGSLDTGFATGSGTTSQIFKVAVLSDGKILIGGDFSTFNTAARGRIHRLNSDGSNDMTFNPGGAGFLGRVRDFAVQTDGKIAVVGGFPSFNGTPRPRAARLNADGTLDTTFDPGTVGFPSEVAMIQPLPDGKYLVVGNGFTTVSGLPRNRIVRLRSNGSLDPKFVSGLGPAGQAAALRFILPHNGKYIIGGTFDTFNTSARSSIASISNTTKAPVDFDGDGKTDFAIARHVGLIGAPWTYWITLSGSGQITTFNWGLFGVDGLQPGDYDGDGMTDVAVWRGNQSGGQQIGYWIILSTTNSFKFIQFGVPGDRPVLEDYDGDGKDDMSVWRSPGPTTIGQGTWFYRGSLNNPTGAVTYVPWGMRYGDQSDQEDDLYPGDFDGDGKADFRVQRRVDTSVGTSNTPGIFYTLSSSTGQVTYDYFGWASDRSIPGDYDGDGKTDIAIARGFNITPNVTTWFIRYTGGIADAAFQWGAGGLDQFAQGDYDGDGITDPTIYRRANQNDFWVLRSSDATVQVFHWGQGDTGEACFVACDVAVATFNNR